MKTFPFLSFIFFGVIIFQVKVVGQKLEWVKTIPATIECKASSITTDGSGNVYSIGQFRGKIDLDPGPDSTMVQGIGYRNIFISKLDSNGNMIWAKSLTGVSPFNQINVDQAGNVYFVGSFYLTVDVDPGPGVVNLTGYSSWGDLLICKLNQNGDFVWAKQIGGASSYGTECYDIKIGPSGSLYLTGGFSGTVDFDPSSASNFLINGSARDMYLCKLDSSGNLIWVDQIKGGNSDNNGYAIALDDDENVFVSGMFIENTDFDPSSGTHILQSNGSWDAFIAKYNSFGQLIWVQKIGGSDYDRSFSVSLDDFGNVYCSGTFKGWVDFDFGPGNYPLYSDGGFSFIVKIDSTGNFIWAKRVGGIIKGMMADKLGNVLFAGSIVNYDFDLEPAGVQLNSNRGSFFTAILDSDGSFIIANNHVGENSEFGKSIAIDCRGYLYSTGWFSGKTDFDFGIDSFYVIQYPGEASFIHKMSFCRNSISTQSVQSCGSYTWNGNTYNSSGIFYDTIYNSAGCDSIMTLNLTIHSTTTSTQNESACDNFIWNGNVYNSTGVYHDTISNASGCDSIMTLNLTIHSTTTSTQNESACDNLIWNGNVYNSTGVYHDTIDNSAGCDSLMTLNLTIHSTTTSTQNESACDNFIWNGNVYNSTGVYHDTINNSAGCDSIMTLDLLINTLNTNVSEIPDGLSAEMNNAEYQWLDCAQNYSKVADATNQIFAPIFSGNYAVEIKDQGCIDTSSCVRFEYLSNLFQISVQPNPFTYETKITSTYVWRNAIISVIDCFGQKVLELKDQKGQFFTLPRNNLAPGIYFVQLKEVITSLNGSYKDNQSARIRVVIN